MAGIIDAKAIEVIYERAKAEFPSLLRIRAEQVLKWGEDGNKSLFLLLAVLGEEFGELCKAVLEGVNNSLRAHDARVEALQTAAVAIAIAERMTLLVEGGRSETITP